MDPSSPPSPCPYCGLPVPTPLPDRCRRCKAPLTGPAAEELAGIHAEIAALDAEAAPLQQRLAALAARRNDLWARRIRLVNASAGRRPELGRRSARDILLLVGVGLLTLAALIFTAVSWETLGVWGRAAVLTTLMAGALALPWPLARRGLGGTAESVGAVGLGLVVMECYAVYTLNDGWDERWSAVVGAVVVTLVWTAYGWRAPLRVPSAAAVFAAQFPLPLVAHALDGGPFVYTATFLGSAALTLLVLLRDVPVWVRRVALAAGAFSFFVSPLFLTLAWVDEDGFRDAFRLLVFTGTAAALAALWTVRASRFFAWPAALVAVLATALPLSVVVPDWAVPAAVAVGALPPLALAHLRAHARALGVTVPRPARKALNAAPRARLAFQVVPWLFAGTAGLIAAVDVVPSLLSRHEIAADWSPGVLGVLAAAFAVARLPLPALAGAGAALAAVPSAAGFAETPTLVWFAALYLAFLVRAFLSRGSLPVEAVSAVAAGWVVTEQATGPGYGLPAAAGVFLTLTVASATARSVPGRIVAGVGAALWSGVTAHHAFAFAEWDAPVEGLTLPVAVGALLLGIVWRASLPSSWLAYGPALALGLLPTLGVIVSLDDTGLTRPLLLGAASLAVLVLGIRLRLQAPAVVGAVVLVLDALHQAAPYAVEIWETVPQWIPIGAAGLLLLVLGATYERHMANARRLRATLAAMA
ncbi:hypothetical protein LO762_24595 [Actinocorallia sp. API 0066]|uniref:SCO7613 C-terminal domain-containing membrane protein n=1 Tax=Actinocorallia sp. API 0066 TaxID=2896846 RepID=UPI001E2AA67C|nr:hypothetical protein [Actinocorallia sp. API 0066]MCD0452345.1 hypothetical protein [Actinocorallia sp. API 0066]